jgi:uncharacterized protein (DUF983 family)
MKMELSLDVASEVCPFCGTANLFSGFSTMLAYTFKQCGKLVRPSDDLGVERLFGSGDH